jgi:hypothetical protein
MRGGGIVPGVMALTSNQREALRLLADAGEGSTVPALVRHGCTVQGLHRLVRDGLASAERMQVRGKPPSRAVLYLRISRAGRDALARHRDRSGRARISVQLLLLVLFVLGVLAGVVVGALLMPHA